MEILQTVTAKAQRSGNWWAIEVEEIPGLFTQVRRLDQVESQVKDAAKLLDYDVRVVQVDARLEQSDMAMLAEVSEAKQKAVSAQEAASVLTRRAIDTLREQGMTLRDIAALIGITPQRVSMITRNA